MKFKLDENFGTRTRQVFRSAGHDTQTVRDESLQGSSDRVLYSIALEELSQPRRFLDADERGFTLILLLSAFIRANQRPINSVVAEPRYDSCCAEQRCLVTLDLDFADVTRFPPGQTAGVAVMRVPRNPSLPLLEDLVRQFLQAVDTMPVSGHLWIIEAGRIRVHQSADEE